MRTSFRTFALLLALLLALVAVPSVVMAASGQSLGASMAAAFGAEQSSLESGPGGDWQPARHGTVPPPTPRPIPPQPVPPRPVYPTPAPSRPSSQGAAVGTMKIVQVIGYRLSAVIYAFTDNDRLYRSNSNGRSWVFVSSNAPVDNFLMSAADPNVLYGGPALDCSGTSVVLAPMHKSTDGGYTWTELSGGFNLKPMLIDPSDPDTLFAADCATIYLSTDGGMTWSPKPAAAADNLWQTYAPVEMSSASLVGNATTPNFDQIFAAGNDAQGIGLVAFTGDRGDTWANITSATDQLSGVRAVVASVFEGGKLWVVDNQGVWSSADYGVNCTLDSAGLETLLRTHTPLYDLEYAQDGSLYLATGSGLYVQSAPGAAWTRATGGNLGSETMYNLLITETNPGRLWINAQNRNGDPMVFSLLID